MMIKLPILPCAEKLELVLSTAPKTSDNTDKDSKTTFSSQRMKSFAREWNFNLTTSPTYAQCNGMVERFVQTKKSLF